MSIRGFFCAYLICVFPSVAAAQGDRAGYYAECGFLAHVAVEQMKKRDAPSSDIRSVRNDVVAFTQMYYRAAAQPVPHTGSGISYEMLQTIVNAGVKVHKRRISGISDQNALRLSNRVLDDCRSDWAMFAKKETLN